MIMPADEPARAGAGSAGKAGEAGRRPGVRPQGGAQPPQPGVTGFRQMQRRYWDGRDLADQHRKQGRAFALSALDQTQDDLA